MKDLTKMMIISSAEDGNIKNVNYFEDLKITAAFHRTFPCGIIHRKTECRENCFSLELIADGEVYLNLDDEKLHLKAPCLFWIGERTKYFQYEIIPDVTYEHYWVDFSGERGRRIYESLLSAYPESFINLKSGRNIKNIFEYFTHKFQVARRPASSPDDVLKIEQLMYEITKEHESYEYDPKDPYGINNLAAKIKNSPFEKYDLPELAAQANLSYVHFRTLFKKAVGQSIGQYILEQQMLTAAELLKNRQFRIGELADYCGFDDITSFTRSFKRYFKLSPKQWLAETEK